MRGKKSRKIEAQNCRKRTQGKDNVVRAVILRTSKNCIERQTVVHPLEIRCYTTNDDETSQLYSSMEVFKPKRTVAAVAKMKIHDIQQYSARRYRRHLIILIKFS